jgi:hypothetical protein
MNNYFKKHDIEKKDKEKNTRRRSHNAAVKTWRRFCRILLLQQRMLTASEVEALAVMA